MSICTIMKNSNSLPLPSRRHIFTCSIALALGLLPATHSEESPGPAEPLYRGKLVAYWVSALEPARSISAQTKQVDAEEAIHSLGPDAVPFILKYQNPNRKVRLQLIEHACALVEPEGDLKLIEALSDSNPALRETALEVLPKTALLGGLGDVIRLSADPIRSVRVAAILALVRLAPDREETVSALVEFLHDTSSSVSDNDFSREDAAYTLGTLGSKARGAVPELMSLLSDPKEQIRETAASALWRIERNPNVVPVLVETLESSQDYQTNLRVMKTLGEIGSDAKSAIPVLQKKVEDPGVRFLPPDVDLSRAAVDSLTKIDPKAGAEARKKLETLPSNNK